MLEGKSLGNYVVREELGEFSDGASGTWLHARSQMPGAGPEDLFIQAVPRQDVVKVDFTPGTGEAWERLTDTDNLPPGFPRMQDASGKWVGKYWAFAYEYKIWDDPNHPCGWLSGLLDQPRDMDPQISLGSFLGFATTLWKIVEHLHGHGLLHYNIRPSCVLYMRGQGNRLNFSLYGAGTALSRHSIPEAELEYYEEKDLPHHSRQHVCDAGYAGYDAASDRFAAARLLQCAIDRVEEPELEYEQIMEEVEQQLALQHRDPGSVLKASRESILANVGDLTDAARGATIDGGFAPEEFCSSTLADYDRIEKVRQELKRQIVDGQVDEGLAGRELADLIQRGKDTQPRIAYEKLVCILGDETTGAPQALDRGEGREDTDRLELEIRGEELRTGVILDLEHYSSPWDDDEDEGSSGDTESKLYRLARIENRTDRRSALRRESPELPPGKFRLLARYKEAEDGEDTGLDLEVLEAEGPPHFESLEPAVVEDCSRPANLVIRGRRLHRTDRLEIGPGNVVGGMMSHGDLATLERTEGSEDRSCRIERVVGPLNTPGVYHLLNEGETTGLSVEVRRRDHLFETVEPSTVVNDDAFECVVRGNYLIAGLSYTLVDADGFAAGLVGREEKLELSVEAESPMEVHLKGPAGLRLGEYELHCDGGPTDLQVKSVCRVETLTPAKVYTRGRPRDLVVTGGLFESEADYSLRHRSSGVETLLGEPKGDRRSLTFAQPGDLPNGRYELMVDGEPTGAELTARPIPVPVLVGGAVGAAIALLIGLFLLGAWIAAPDYEEVLSPAALVYVYAPHDGSPMYLHPPMDLTLDGSAMEPAEKYFLVPASSLEDPVPLKVEDSEPSGAMVDAARGLVGVFGAGGEGERYGQVHFQTLDRLPADCPLVAAEDVYLLLRFAEGDAEDSSEVVPDGVPALLQFKATQDMEIKGFECRQKATQPGEIAEFRLPSEGEDKGPIDITIHGQGMGLLAQPGIITVLECESGDLPVSVKVASENAAHIHIEDRSQVEFGMTLTLTVRPAGVEDQETPPSEMELVEFVLKRSQGFEGVARAVTGEAKPRIEALNGEPFFLKPSPNPASNPAKLQYFLVLSGEGPPQRIPTKVLEQGEWLKIEPEAKRNLAGAAKIWKVCFRRNNAEEESDCSVRLHPLPEFVRWNNPKPVAVGKQGAERKPKLFVKNASSVETIRLTDPNGRGGPLDLKPAKGGAGGQGFLELDLAPVARRLLPGNIAAAEYELSFRATFFAAGEYRRLSNAKVLMIVNANRTKQFLGLVKAADEAFAAGQVSVAEAAAAQARDPRFKAVDVAPDLKDRVGFYAWFIEAYYRGIWQGGEASDFAPETDAYKLALALLKEIETRHFGAGAQPLVPPNFSIDTPDTVDDWITHFIRGYDAHTLLTLRGEKGRAAVEKVAIEEIGAAAESEKVLSPLLLIELQAGVFRGGGLAAFASAEKRLDGVIKAAAIPEQVALATYFRLLAILRSVAAGAGPKGGVAKPVVDVVKELAGSVRSRSAMLSWFCVKNGEVFPRGGQGPGELKAAYKQIREQLLPEVARFMDARFGWKPPAGGGN